MTIKRVLGDRILIRRKPEMGEILIFKGPDDREPPFEALVVGVGAKLSEDIKPGDTVMLAAPVSQDRVGTRKVIWNGEPAELVSSLDVVGIIWPTAMARKPLEDLNGPMGSTGKTPWDRYQENQ